ncbi:MAG: hypothetical protein AB1938_16000 [Myxococcota bacterium]
MTLVMAAADVEAKPAVSVLYFENRSGSARLDVLGRGLPELMVTALVAPDGVTVVERERLRVDALEKKGPDNRLVHMRAQLAAARESTEKNR